jgi:hypothetical protein
MTNINNDKSSPDHKIECIKCKEFIRKIHDLEQDLTKAIDESSCLYRVHEDDIFKITELKDELSRIHGETERGQKI